MWLGQLIKNEQRGDGFFVFSQHDAKPPVIAETYFGVVSLRQLGMEIPKKARLNQSLLSLEAEAEAALRVGQRIVDGRDLYELVMIHRLIDFPLNPHSVEANVIELRKVVLQSPQSFGGLRDWYYGLLALKLMGELRLAERDAAARIAVTLLDSKEVSGAPFLVEVALLVDALSHLEFPLSDKQRSLAIKLIEHSRVENAGAFASGQLPDVVTTFFVVLTANVINEADIVDRAKMLEWLDRHRDWSGYRIALDQPVNPLGTAYALSLRHLAESGNLANVSR
jgi:hypothetical protein